MAERRVWNGLRVDDCREQQESRDVLVSARSEDFESSRINLIRTDLQCYESDAL